MNIFADKKYLLYFFFLLAYFQSQPFKKLGIF